MRTLPAAVLCLVSFALFAQPSLILKNGRIFDNPNAQAIAITGSTITAVGTNADIAALATPQTRVIDAGGRLVIPGFNDAHTHPGLYTASFIANSDIDTAWPNIAAAISAAVDETPADLWITATVGPAVINDATLTKQTLDKLAPGRKVFISAFTGHGAVLSSAGLADLGITAATKDPTGGAFERDAQGNLTGRASEYANYALDRRFAEEASDDEVLAGIRSFADEAIRFGVTSVQAMPFLTESRFAKLLRTANVPLRVRQITFPASADARPEFASGGALKLILDGTPIERGAALRTTQYPDGTRGRLNFRDLAPFVKLAVDNNQQLILHTAGDASVAAALKAFSGSTLKRPRLEHGDGLQSDLFPLAKKTGAVVVVNPTHFPFRGTYPAGQYMLAKSLLGAQIPLAIGSDGPLNPGLNLMLAVARPDQPAESLTREEALRAYTTGSAYAENLETKKGKIAPGMLADLAVLSQNILDAPVEALPDTRSVLTIIDGKVVHQE
jgi:predicted amidohydrolase YtcJ